MKLDTINKANKILDAIRNIKEQFAVLLSEVMANNERSVSLFTGEFTDISDHEHDEEKFNKSDFEIVQLEDEFVDIMETAISAIKIKLEHKILSLEKELEDLKD